MVFRKVEGLPDENSYLSGTIKPTINTCADQLYYQQLASGSADLEPDIFSYSTPTGGGKFMLIQIAPVTAVTITRGKPTAGKVKVLPATGSPWPPSTTPRAGRCRRGAKTTSGAGRRSPACWT
ncbi:MAG: hypothetical protein ICV83_06925 [Cytophagales bacterium]|nr:hypothetical protein [Cytophagales bacterium]